MLKIGRRASTLLSLILDVVYMAGLVFGAAVMPRLCRLLTGTRNLIAGREPLTAAQEALILADAYVILAVAAAVGAALFVLILKIRKGEVFTQLTVSLIRLISWLCVLGGVLFALLGPVFLLSFAVACVACFVGLCLRVVKNAFEEALAIKDENDYTI